ncbi:radical SAM family heme chaperone HemW [Sporosarcina thermotolerans]|uniref:radical SAM family heme chaperone HemW n=1 Tax=Sporosarcina thermotolerans TaxID=633404 RepID=UPI0024BD15F3|nr:radical SAM family heme chaperone HemW [Sporosarcina thermotolerans]WHT47537.1 radical SAM family heme chaperone HemW [Sporosarcina thermotolerans]
MRGMYIHIPFCHQICHYCDFNKVFFKNQPVDEYIEWIGNELSIMKEEGTSFKSLETVFLGGGTPTALSENQLERLLEIIHQYVDVSSLKEFSTEANPDELTNGKLSVLKNGGVGRLSIGVQSFDTELLKRIGRTHGADDPIRVIENARKIGFENISIDLIYGLPGQTIQQWEDTLNKALSLDLPHYSGYSLIVEPKTVFYNLMNKGKLPLPGEDMETSMFSMLIDRMEAAGRRQYEISNFSIQGKESIHNLIYWENDEYAGIGAGAHGYLNGQRYANIGPLKKYMESADNGTRPIMNQQEVTKIEAMEEEMFLGLRKTDGVSFNSFEMKFGKTLPEVYGAVIKELSNKGLVQISEEHIKLTIKGVFRGNEVFQEFLH